MSLPLKKQEYYINNYSNPYAYDYSVVKPIKKARKKKNKKGLIATFFALAILGAYGYWVCPYTFKQYFRPLILNRYLNKNIKVDAKKYMNPTLNYLSNSNFLGENLRTPYVENSKLMADIQIISELTDTKNKVIELFKKHPNLEPAVFVWEYSTGAGFEINADKVYPSASIIKVPIAVTLMRLIDKTSKTKEPITLNDRIEFNELFRTSGSGDLQKTKANVFYSVNYLTNIMIANSDNSATNMILYKIGGIQGLNASMRNLGLKHTRMRDVLPDLEGTNTTTAREISNILYNIDNPKFVNPKYKNVLKEYLGNTKNIHLIKEKLPKDVMVLHKTGNIGSMIGDSGIVYTNNGKKYIITIMVKRPHNDLSAKPVIQDASLLIYNDIKNL